MMIQGLNGFIVISALTLLSSCAKLGNPNAPCNNAGYYASQTECQKSAGTAGCSAVTVFAEDQSNLLCWKASVASLNTSSVSNPGGSTSSSQTNTQTNTQTGPAVGCGSTQAPPWSMGAWTPANCGPGVQSRTRTVACNFSCPCAQPIPSGVETCEPNLFGGNHYDSECVPAGGSLEWIDGKRFCIFRDKPIPGMAGTNNNERTDAVCPSGWTVIYSGSLKLITTSPRTAEDHTTCTGGRVTRSTGYHSSFLPAKEVESFQYCTWRNCFQCKRWETQTALITKIACY